MSRTPFAALPDDGPTECEAHGELLKLASNLRISDDYMTVEADRGCSFYLCKGCLREEVFSHVSGDNAKVDVPAFLGTEKTLGDTLSARVFRAFVDQYFPETAHNTHRVEADPDSLDLDDFSLE